MIRIDWRTIPHNEQRYNSSGDWNWQLDAVGDLIMVLHIRTSRLSDPRYEFCLGLHELVEAMLCYFARIYQHDVDAFDMPFEEAHQRGDSHYPCGCPRTEFSDPGGDKHAPYAFQHKIADAVERIVAAVLGIQWRAYDAEVDHPPDELQQ